MKTLQTLLRAADPVTREPEMAPADVERMRRTVMTARENKPARSWVRLVAVAGALALTIGVLVERSSGHRRPETAKPADGPSEDAAQPTAPGRRQLQFATPGGTRVIWVFDPDFDVR